MMNVMELMIKVINVLINAVETVGTSVGLTPHEARMCFVIAVGVSLGIQSAHSLEHMRAREKAIKESDIDGVFNRITTKSLINNKAVKKTANIN